MSSRTNLDILKELFNEYFDPVQETYTQQKNILKQGFWVETLHFESFCDFFSKNQLAHVYLNIDVGPHRSNPNGLNLMRSSNSLDFILFEDDYFEIKVFSKKGELKKGKVSFSGKALCRKSFLEMFSSDFLPFSKTTHDLVLFCQMVEHPSSVLRRNMEQSENIFNTQNYVKEISDPSKIFSQLVHQFFTTSTKEDFRYFRDKLVERAYLWDLDLNFLKEETQEKTLTRKYELHSLMKKVNPIDFGVYNVLYLEKYAQFLDKPCSNVEFISQCIEHGNILNKKLNKTQEIFEAFRKLNVSLSEKYDSKKS